MIEYFEAETILLLAPLLLNVEQQKVNSSSRLKMSSRFFLCTQTFLNKFIVICINSNRLSEQYGKSLPANHLIWQLLPRVELRQSWPSFVEQM